MPLRKYLSREDIDEIATAAGRTPMGRNFEHSLGIGPGAVQALVAECLMAAASNPHVIDDDRSEAVRIYRKQRAGAKAVMTGEQVGSYATGPFGVASAEFEAKIEFLKHLVAHDQMTVGEVRVHHQIVVQADVIDVDAGPMLRDANWEGHSVLRTQEFRPWPRPWMATHPS